MGNPNLENYPRDVTQLLCVCRWVLGKGKKMVMGHWQSLHEETASSPLVFFLMRVLQHPCTWSPWHTCSHTLGKNKHRGLHALFLTAVAICITSFMLRLASCIGGGSCIC